MANLQSSRTRDSRARSLTKFDNATPNDTLIKRLSKLQFFKHKTDFKTDFDWVDKNLDLSQERQDTVPKFISFSNDEPQDDDYTLIDSVAPQTHSSNPDFREEIRRSTNNPITRRANKRQERTRVTASRSFVNPNRVKPKIDHSNRDGYNVQHGEVSRNFQTEGEWKNLFIVASQLNLKLYRVTDLKENLYHNDPDFFRFIGKKPAVGILFENSVLQKEGVRVGDILFSVNREEVFDLSDALSKIQNSPRPLHLSFFSPDIKINYSEGFYMTKMDENSTEPPKSSKLWTPTYTVIGGIIESSHIMHVYRSKHEYDKAVMETMAKKKVTVTSRKISLLNYRIWERAQGPKSIHYSSQKNKWKYFVLQPRRSSKESVIIVASINHSSLKSIFRSISKVLLESNSSVMSETGSRFSMGSKVSSVCNSYSAQTYDPSSQPINYLGQSSRKIPGRSIERIPSVTPAA